MAEPPAKIPLQSGPRCLIFRAMRRAFSRKAWVCWGMLKIPTIPHIVVLFVSYEPEKPRARGFLPRRQGLYFCRREQKSQKHCVFTPFCSPYISFAIVLLAKIGYLFPQHKAFFRKSCTAGDFFLQNKRKIYLHEGNSPLSPSGSTPRNGREKEKRRAARGAYGNKKLPLPYKDFMKHFL